MENTENTSLELSLNDPFYSEKTIIINGLYRVLDPELMINIMDMGLVYGLSYDGQTIRITMTLSTPHCPLEEAITAGIRNSLGIDFPGVPIEVTIVWEPAWNYTMLSPEGREQLGF